MGSTARNVSNLRFTGVLLIIFGIVYITFGTLALTGVLGSTLPGHENQETAIVVLAYIAGILPIITGIAALKEHLIATIIFSILFTVVCVISLICVHASHGVINIIDTIGIGWGCATFIYALRCKALD